MTVVNDYTYWEHALARGDQISNDRDLKVDAEMPQPGFYRTRDNKGVAIWYDDDGLNFLIDGTQVRGGTESDNWMWVCRRPVTEAQFRAYGDSGKWHDIDNALIDTLGSNIAGAEDPETIQSLLTQLQAAAGQYQIINNEEDQKRAHGIRARINELRLRAEKLHKAEKEPHLKAGQAVDRRWNPMVKDATAAAAKLGQAMGRYEDAKRIAIRRAEIEAEEARRKAEEANLPPPPAPVLPEPASQVRSGYGRAASVKVKPTVVEITDMAALLRRYS